MSSPQGSASHFNPASEAENTPRLRGPVFAIVTPFDETGNIDWPALTDYLQFLHGQGVNEIITGGTAGEFPSLSFRERRALLEHCRAHFPGQVVANVSATAVPECQALLAHAGKYANAVLTLPPFYYADATEMGLRTFFERALESATLPLYLYNFPRHTNVPIPPTVVSWLAGEFANLVGIKDSSGDLDSSLRYKAAAEKLTVLVGADSLAYAALEKGLDGSITGSANPVPECLLAIRKAFLAGEHDLSRRWQGHLDVWNAFRRRAEGSEIAVVKAGLRARLPGFPLFVRPPLSRCSEAQAAGVVDFFTNTLLPVIRAEET
jgi:4-hydroxy-tetrahydrodipicolinate synthase